MDYTWATKEVLEGREVERNHESGILIMFMEDELIKFKFIGIGNIALDNVGMDDIIATDWRPHNKPFNLSKKVISESGVKCYIEDDVKEFIKQIKESIDNWDRRYQCDLNKIIDKLAGERFK